jgi:hypothetical protein
MTISQFHYLTMKLILNYASNASIVAEATNCSFAKLFNC